MFLKLQLHRIEQHSAGFHTKDHFHSLNMSQLRWLITGCSSGIEETLARNILARGDKIVATGRGNVARLASLKRAGAETVALDVMSSTQDIKTAVDQIRKDGPIDVPVNNVANIEGGSAEELRYTCSEHSTGSVDAVAATKVIYLHMRPIFSVSSILHRLFYRTFGRDALDVC